MTTVPERWRKSSRSGQDTNCVEIEMVSRMRVRDSKNPTGPRLALEGGLSGLLAAVKADTLTR